jgi:Glycosyl transferase family 2
MISILTLTYHRHHLLEEAIYSFLCQNQYQYNCEMVVINDSQSVKYVIQNDNLKVRTINTEHRFKSLSAKLEFGYKQCRYENIYRLDDDDLLSPWAINNACDDILNNPGYEIYRSHGHYFFIDNKFIKISNNINNGNIYTKKYLDRITFPDKTSNEDVEITFENNAKIYTSTLKPTMIYRWGMNTYHISGLGTGNSILNKIDNIINKEEGEIILEPKFNNNYYEELPDL